MEAKTKKIVIASSIIGALILVTGAFILRAKRKKLEQKIQEGSEDILEPAQKTASEVVFPLRKGSGVNEAEKNAVKVVQRYINAKGTVGLLQLVTIEEDGIFGIRTETALNKLSGINEVSYSLYKEMYNFLNQVPTYLKQDSAGYTGIDPIVEKNNIFDFGQYI